MTLKKGPRVDFDDVLEELGEFGPYQIITYLLICLPVFFAAANSLSYVFTAGVPNYRCYVPRCDDLKPPTYNEVWVPEAIPSSRTSTEYQAAQCEMYKPGDNYTDLSKCPVGQFTEEVIGCDAWVFDDEWTIVGEWNITCPNNQWKLSLVGTVHFAGIVTGALLFGYLADKLGRKNVFVFYILLMAVSGIFQAFSSHYITFQIFVFINALGTAGVFPLAFIIGLELVGRKKREMSGIVLNYFYAVGEAAVALVAWYFKDWRLIQLTVSAPCLVFVVYYWAVPESVRWLLANRKHTQASDAILKAAKRNRVVLSEQLLKTFGTDAEKGDVKVSPSKGDSPMRIRHCILQIIKSRKLLLRSLSLFFNWAANGFVFYGLSINSTNLGGDKYLNFALVCLIEIPGYTLSWFSLRSFGRRKSLFGSLLLCAVTCVGAALVPQGDWWAETLLFLIGKLGITSSFGTIYVYTAEMYPTIMRSAGVGASSTVAMLGALLAPFAALLAQYNRAFPLFLFGGVAFIAALLTLLYPETKGKKLPETIEDIKQLL